MAKRCDRSFVNTEVHRLKNRVRQQRYRALKREEKDRLYCPHVCSLQILSVPITETAAAQIRPAVKSQYEQPFTVELVAAVAKENPNISSEPCQAFHAHVIQHLPQMETVHGINVLKAQDNSSMKPPCQSEVRRCHEDVLARRAKNRERQRRYRARKRLETDMKKAGFINQPNPLALQIPNQSGFINRVLCHRNWKKEARQVHVSKKPRISQNEPPLASFTSQDRENLSSLPSEDKINQLEEKKELKAEHQLNGNVKGANEATHS
ncbi:hypothetical protein MKW94_016676 [Papaver nudicaule]|uniref:Uncharacterized protein n=1 Tax=Papaver nudicaule TaxID=74823 RepID=A0AA41SE97_PAPNU|nr:hypothetical protein [Papaver nudicaule]